MPVTRADEMDALAERVEKLTGADRRVDAEICRLFDLPKCEYPDCLPDVLLRVIDRVAAGGGDPDVPAYTSSLDAAMSLVPEGYAWTLSTIGTENFSFWCSVSFPDEDAGSDQANSATPALALTAACLRAHASIIREAGRE